MRKIIVLSIVVLLVVAISAPAFAGGRNDRGYYNNRGRSYYNYRPPVRIQRGYGNRGGGFDRSFERGFGRGLGENLADFVFDGVRYILTSPKEVVVVQQQPAIPFSGSAYSQAYEEEILRLQQREFFRQQALDVERGRQDARRDFYGK